MKKTYIAPDLQVVMSDEAFCDSLIVASGNSQNSSGEQLVKDYYGDDAWDIWEDDAE